jgi:hypothetical protein
MSILAVDKMELLRAGKLAGCSSSYFTGRGLFLFGAADLNQTKKNQIDKLNQIDHNFPSIFLTVTKGKGREGSI